MSDESALFAVRLWPRQPGRGHLLHSHLEAYDHLAIATDHADGSVEVSGPLCHRDEIVGAVRDIARAVGWIVGE